MTTDAPRARASRAKKATEPQDLDPQAVVDEPEQVDEQPVVDDEPEDDLQPIRAVGVGDVVALPDGRAMPREEYDARMALLTRPFAKSQVEKLPRPVDKRDDTRGRCEPGSNVSADGHYCGGWHSRSVHLDYVGHAGITMRLLEVDPAWDYEFQHVDLPAWVEKAVALSYERGDYEEAKRLVRAHGAPVSRDGGYWITLTVLGQTRKGFGDANGKTGPMAMKEVIGDALRNAAMRFGAGTYLWSKSDEAKTMKQGVDVSLPDVRSVESELHVATEAPDPIEALTSVGMKYGEHVLQQVQYTRKTDGQTITAWAALTHLLGWARDKAAREQAADRQEADAAQAAVEQESQDAAPVEEAPVEAPAPVEPQQTQADQRRQEAAAREQAAEAKAAAPRNGMVAVLTNEVIAQAQVLGVQPTKYTEGFLRERGVENLADVSPVVLKAWVLQQRPVVIDALEQQGRASEAASYRAAGGEVKNWQALVGTALPTPAERAPEPAEV